MTELKWNDKLNVGVRAIDREHQELIRIVNHLLGAVERGDGREAVDKVIKKLREYTVFHFNNEEDLMESIRYPDRATQMSEHTRLKKDVKDYQRALQKGRRDPAGDRRLHEAVAAGSHPDP